MPDGGRLGCCVLQQVLQTFCSHMLPADCSARHPSWERRCCWGLGSCLPGRWLGHSSLLVGLRAACWQVRRGPRPSPPALEGAVPAAAEGRPLLSFSTVLPPDSGALCGQEGSGTVLPPATLCRPRGAQHRKCSCSAFLVIWKAVLHPKPPLLLTTASWNREASYCYSPVVGFGPWSPGS